MRELDVRIAKFNIAIEQIKCDAIAKLNALQDDLKPKRTQPPLLVVDSPEYRALHHAFLRQQNVAWR